MIERVPALELPATRLSKIACANCGDVHDSLFGTWCLHCGCTWPYRKLN